MKRTFYTLLLFAAVALPLRAQEIAGPTYDLEEYEGGKRPHANIKNACAKPE
ncbi:MAG: hypothetical protein IPM61_13585 [Chlorobi bacterium]|nr:hypothetical protein [Chlorobiota bacterium]